MTFRIGIDVGGTFTDFLFWSSDGNVEVFKVLSTPIDPSIAVLEGITNIARSKGLEVSDFVTQISTIVHGTTVTTNAVLTRNAAKTGLLTTEGVRDALEMRRGIREEQYNNRYENVKPIVPRYLRIPIKGRLNYEGKELEPLCIDNVHKAIETLKKENVEAVAVCFMNAFANNVHERAAKEIIESELKNTFLSVSSDVLPTVRFYNRVSTTVLNAYVGPVLCKYLDQLTEKLNIVGFKGILLIMQSNGGVAVPEIIKKWPASTLLSGPAAGPRAAVAHTKEHGRKDCILVDMGGTSFDASLVKNGSAEMTNEGEIDRLRIALPMLDITTIGAGGGSIGWIDEGGLLRMGPMSAGALPGPACYERGGVKPACTDADLVLGYLNPEFFAGGKMKLNVELSKKAIKEHIADPLDMNYEEAAAGMYRVINSNMAHGVREITVKKGLDPREFPMVIAGGAGSLHACMIADELEIPTLIVPTTASILCAAGMLFSDLQHDFVRTYISTFKNLDVLKLNTIVNEMVEEGSNQLVSEGIPDSEIIHNIALDLRYLKQYHEVTLPVDIDLISKGKLNEISDVFHKEHNRLYGYDLSEEKTDLEIINIRIRSTGLTEKPVFSKLTKGTEDSSHAIKNKRRAFVPEKQTFEEISVYDGHKLLTGNRIPGPALIERINTTVFISLNYTALVDDFGNYVLNRQAIA